MMSNKALMNYYERQVIVNEVNKEIFNNWQKAIESLEKYNDHPSEELRLDLLALAWRVAIETKNTAIRQKLVNYLLNSAMEETLFLRGQALKFLQYFPTHDFNPYSVDKLAHVSLSDDYASEMIRLIGIADVRSRADELTQMAAISWQGIDSHVLYASPNWASSLVLARFGDLKNMQRILTQVNNEDNIVLRATKLFKDLTYTKKAAAYDALKFYLHSEERLPQTKNTVPGRLEAIYAAELFVQNIEGCPISNSDLNENDIHMIRRWAEKQTQWKIR